MFFLAVHRYFRIRYLVFLLFEMWKETDYWIMLYIFLMTHIGLCSGIKKEEAAFLTSGAVCGIVMGAILLTCVAFCGCCCVMQRKKKRKNCARDKRNKEVLKPDFDLEKLSSDKQSRTGSVQLYRSQEVSQSLRQPIYNCKLVNMSPICQKTDFNPPPAYDTAVTEGEVKLNLDS